MTLELADLLRELGPQVLGVLVRRGNDFAAAEDAVQEALVEAVRRWPEGRPDDPKAWLVTVAGRKLIDEQRSAIARARREERVEREPAPGPTEQADDTLLLLSRCCHPALSAASAVALTLRAVGGLTTAQIAQAFLVPEATMAQRISRAKRTVSGQRFDQLDVKAGALAVLDELHRRERGVGNGADGFLGMRRAGAPGKAQRQGGGQQCAASSHGESYANGYGGEYG